MNFLLRYRMWLLLLLIATAGCNKAIDVMLPAGTINTELTFKDDVSANNAMRGLYAGLTDVWSTSPFSGGIAMNLGLASDELIRATYSADQQLFFDNNLSAAVAPNLSALWRPFYSYIYQSNNVIENVQKSAGMTEPMKKQLIGETRFMRAFCYFYLVTLYDSVPLLLTPDYRVNALAARNGPDAIYKQIIEDLDFAKVSIGTAYAVQGMRIRPTNYTVQAVLARVHLYRQQWKEAEEAATAVINAGPYKLDTLDGVFQTNSREAIWAAPNAGTNLYTVDGGRMGGSATSNTAFRLSDYFLNEFEPGDQRKVKWTRTTAGAGTAPAKYKVFSNGGTRSESTMILRLAEQYLIRAEARAQQDNLPGAIADVDSLRKRAGLELISVTLPGITKDSLLKNIAHERMVELFSEYAHRWFDVIRRGEINTVFKVRKSGWRDGVSQLLPIPADERKYNPNLTQNKGYE